MLVQKIVEKCPSSREVILSQKMLNCFADIVASKLVMGCRFY